MSNITKAVVKARPIEEFGTILRGKKFKLRALFLVIATGEM